MNSYLIGADLGQSQDYSTIAVIERAGLLGEFDPVLYASRKVVELRLRVLERIPLGTPYTEVAHRVAQVAAAPALSAGKRHLAIDGTGGGRPVLELVQRERPRATLMPLLVTGGERQSRSGGFYHVPKRDLIVGLQVMFEAGTLRIAKGLPFGTELVQELQSMDVRVTAWGREQYGAFRSGTHDAWCLRWRCRAGRRWRCTLRGGGRINTGRTC